MLGRPKRDLEEQRRLLQYEFQWQVVLGWVRYGAVGADDGIPIEKLNALSKINNETRRNSPDSRLLDAHEIMFDPPEDLPAEPDVWETLTRPNTKPEEVRRLCQTSMYLRDNSTLLKYALEFCDAKKERRYPGAKATRSKLRPSSEEKRGDYLARVLAGFSLGKDPPLSPATADRLLRDLHRTTKHGESCPCWRCVPKHSPSFPDPNVIEKWRQMKRMAGKAFFQKKMESR